MSRKRSDSFSLDDAYLDIAGCTKPASEIPILADRVNELLKTSIIQPGFTSLERIPGCPASLKQQKKDKQREKGKCKGSDWFNFKRPDMTPEIRNDLNMLKMRSVFDPKHYYKKPDIKGLPKYFQVGKYLDSPVDFYSSRVPKKERKKTIVEELMANAEFQKITKRKYKEHVQEYKRTHLKAHQHAKRLKKKKNKK